MGEQSEMNMQIIEQEERLEREWMETVGCIAVEDLWQVVMEH